MLLPDKWLLAADSDPWLGPWLVFLGLGHYSPVLGLQLSGCWGLRSLVVLGPHKVRETRQYQASHWSAGADLSLVIGQIMGLCLVTTVSRVPRLLTRIYNLTKL